MRHGPHSQQGNTDSSVTETSLASSACGSPSSGATTSTSAPVKSPECQRLTRSSTRRSATAKPIKISVSYPSSDAICMSTATTTMTTTTNNNGGVPPPSSSPSPNSSKKSSFSSSSPPPPIYSVHYTNGNRETSVYRSRDPNCHLRVTGSRLATHNRRGSSMRRRSSTDSTLAPGGNQQLLEDKDLSPSPTFDDSNAANKPKLISRMGKRNIKAQVKRFRMETKAAKTLGIIVGGFIVCWLPFFTMYLVRAFCEDCIHHLLFSILFWLGYCNSAINPCIYALFSKDFRFAFKRIICRCLCAKKLKRETRDWNRRRGSDGSQLGTRGLGPGSDRGRSPSYNNNQPYPHNSVGEDSDPGNEGSDSR